MSVWIAQTVSVSAAREFWEFYRQYTHSAIHAASAAALTIFGLLVFVDPLFAGVAIAAYVCPPLVLYALGMNVGVDSEGSAVTDGQPQNETGSQIDSTVRSQRRDGDTDSDGGDTDSDSDGGDTDSDSDGGDTDSDSDGGDTDSDSDGGDTDSDSDGGDTDSDTDNGDTDSDTNSK